MDVQVTFSNNQVCKDITAQNIYVQKILKLHDHGTLFRPLKLESSW